VAAPCRRTDPSIEESLFERGYEFEFFQAVRLLARLYPDRRPVGSTAKPADEIVRFGASTVDSETGKPICMEFPPSAVHEIEPVPGAPDPVRMTVAFMGLTGTQGVLPFYYTERMLARKIAKDGAMAAFFDLFNHRFVSLFYRAWQKYRHPVLYESAGDRIHQPDAFTHSLLDLIGMGTDGLRREPVAICRPDRAAATLCQRVAWYPPRLFLGSRRDRPMSGKLVRDRRPGPVLLEYRTGALPVRGSGILGGRRLESAGPFSHSPGSARPGAVSEISSGW
jgi:predicted component of type VI protein secretion system